MIPISIKKEPISFNNLVRVKGTKYLKKNPSPKSEDWKNHSYWSAISKEFYTLYGGICAYTGEWFNRMHAYEHIDHFLPKSIYPNLAYEWSNYRLATQRVNTDKGSYIDIVDPFQVKAGWFILDLPSCFVLSGDFLDSLDRSKVERTINVLKLNQIDYVNHRLQIIKDLISNIITLDFMHKYYPFIAYELERQKAIPILNHLFRNITNN